MRYVVDIQTKAERSLEDDNLKGERRWERQAARALLDAGRQVGSVRDAWARPDTPLWTGVEKNLSDCALITHADPGSVRYRSGAAAFISNVFCGLTPEAEAEIRRAIAEMGRSRVALTHSFQLNVALKRLPPDLHDLIHWVPVPAVPRVHWDHDPFQNKVFLWSARAISFRLTRPLQTILDLLDWIRGCLVEDPALRFSVLVGEQGMSQAEADRHVWGFAPFAAAFSDVKSQVRVHPSICWSEVMRILAHTKLIVNDPTAFGGAPLEAASFGIPVVGTGFSSFHTTNPKDARWPNAPDAVEPTPAFPEFVCVNGTTSLPAILDIWHRDGAAYRRAGAAYRKYIHETYTYEAFVRYLDGLPVMG